MSKRILSIILVITLILLSGCEFTLPGATQEVPQAATATLSDGEFATLAAISTQMHTTPDEIVPLPTPTFTATPQEPGQGGEGPTATADSANIHITGITQKSPGVALVSWEATGEFPSGFKVVWTDQQGQPTFPENNSIAAGSASARSAVINYTANTIYYVRVCRYLYGACDIYSDLSIFAFAPATPTATVTKTPLPTSSSSGGSTGVTDATLKITLMKGGEGGKAYMTWTDKVTNTKGYRIFYSKTHTSPALGVDSYFVVSDPKARSAYVDGDSNTTYYYRICRFSGTACSAYSATYTYKFPVAYTATPDSASITISGIVDTATGVAQVSWTATGSFPNGFKILYSKTTALPTLSDSVTVVSDGTARVGSISGDPSSTYHVRVCKYNGSTCSVYSAVMDFKFADDPATITISGLADTEDTPGSIDLEWTASGSFPNGFKLLYSTSQANPTFENASSVAISSSAARTGTITAAAKTQYYVRICKFTGTTCGVYSNVLQFTTASSDIVLAGDPAAPDDPTKFKWTIPGDNDDGYLLFWAEGKITPLWSTADDDGNVISVDKADRTATIAALETGKQYIVRLCYWIATGDGTCGDYSNTYQVDIPAP